MKKRIPHPEVVKALEFLQAASGRKGRNLQMPGDPRYQPEELKPWLGYDQWAGWLIIIEWFWMKTLAAIGEMPQKDEALLTEKRLQKMIQLIPTTRQDIVEKKTKHDILALLELMRRYLPKRLHRWLHFCATSYDIICTAYALQIATVYQCVFVTELVLLDAIWRRSILENASVLQAGRTHLQTALPVTVGFWEANLHNRFVGCARKARNASNEVPGKFSGAVGTSASQRALIRSGKGERKLMDMLGLPKAKISTQITPPEGTARFYSELVLLSGVLANLGDDARILQSSQFGEIISDSSSSSAMSHKKANPIAAENAAGMHVSVIAEFGKVLMTLSSNLQRDLRWSNVMRSYSAVMVFVFQQIKTAERLLKSIKVNKDRCRENFNWEAKQIVAELLHLLLQNEGLLDAHKFVKDDVIPFSRSWDMDLSGVMDRKTKSGEESLLWKRIKKKRESAVEILRMSETYLGDAKRIARREAGNSVFEK